MSMLKATIITIVTTVVDLETMQSEHSVKIDDVDGLSEVSREIVGAVLIGAMKSTERGLREQFPQAGAAAQRSDEADDDDSDGEQSIDADLGVED